MAKGKKLTKKIIYNIYIKAQQPTKERTIVKGKDIKTIIQ